MSGDVFTIHIPASIPEGADLEVHYSQVGIGPIYVEVVHRKSDSLKVLLVSCVVPREYPRVTLVRDHDAGVVKP